jgi:hypothetical protein
MTRERFGQDVTPISGSSRSHRGWTILLPVLALACSARATISAREAADANDTGGALKATTESERNILRELSSLPGATPRRLGDTTVVAGDPYLSASGKTCRTLHLSMDTPKAIHDRLACSQGGAWFFVPNVFASELGTAD